VARRNRLNLDPDYSSPLPCLFHAWQVLHSLSANKTNLLESPRYLMKQGRWVDSYSATHPETKPELIPCTRPAKALESFTLLRPAPVSHLLGARDFVYAHFQLEMECKSINSRAAARKPASPPPAPAPTPEAPKKEDPLRQAIIEEGKKDHDVELGQAVSDSEKESALYAISRTHYHQRLRQCFQDPRSRRALVCASTAMIAQQLCGVNTLSEPSM